MITSVFVGTRCGMLLQKMSGLGKNPSFSVSFLYNLYLVHSNLYNSCYGRYHFIRCSGQFARDRGCWCVSPFFLSPPYKILASPEPTFVMGSRRCSLGGNVIRLSRIPRDRLESINRFAHSFCTNFHKVCQTC